MHWYPIARLGANVYYSNVSVEHHTAALETTLLEQGAHTLAQTREILLKNTNNGTIPRYETERMAGKLYLHYIGIRTLLMYLVYLTRLLEMT